MPTLSESQRIQCSGNVTNVECEKVLKLFRNNKSPGNDGITVEFYRQFWQKLYGSLVECYNYSLEKGQLSTSQRQAIITLTEKEGKDRLYIKNWHPISLLNVDYKILTKVLANRIKSVLPSIINCNQTGYVEGRQINQSIRLIQDVMEYTDKRKLAGMLLFIDFEKAFDSIEWNFIVKTLEKFKFGEFIDWVKLLYNNISSCIINIGITSPYFTLSRGVRQGDPLSGYLFIIVIELLAHKVRNDNEISGFQIGHNNVKLTQYVDDLTIMVSNMKSAEKVFYVFNKFEKVSGLKINETKTEGLWLGRNKNSVDKPFKIKWPKGPIKALGVYYSYNTQAAVKANFDIKIEKS